MFTFFQAFFTSSKTGCEKHFSYLESVAGSVIQATGTAEFEYGLRTGVLGLLEGPHLGQDQYQAPLDSWRDHT